MKSLDLVLIVLGVAHIALAIWATRRVYLRLRLSTGKRFFLLVFIWLVPFIGPWVGRSPMSSSNGGIHDPIESYAASGHDTGPAD